MHTNNLADVPTNATDRAVELAHRGGSCARDERGMGKKRETTLRGAARGPSMKTQGSWTPFEAETVIAQRAQPGDA